MRVALLSIGTRGDVQPFVVLGKALLARGHDVVVASGAEFEPMVTGAGLGFVPFTSLGTDTTADMLASPKVKAALRKGPSLFRMSLAAPRRSAADMDAFVEEMVAAADGADVIVNTTLTRIGALVREDTPWCSVDGWPTTPTAAWPALGAPEFPWPGRLAGRYNRVTHANRDYLEWLIYRVSINNRRRAGGLTRLGLRSRLRESGMLRPLLYQFSPSLFPPPPDWPQRCYVTGNWGTNDAGNRPPALARFLADGDSPVVAAFGSAWSVGEDELWEASVDMGRRLGKRLVFVGGPDRELPGDLDAIRVETAEYGWLLPAAAAVMHHGGQGTTAEVAKAGRPQVVVPCYADQPMWARQLAALGVAPRPVPFAKLTGDLLTAAVRTAVTDPSITARAQRLAKAAGQDPGVELAAQVVEDWAAGVSTPQMS
ncbi:glycosyltransferase [Amycolatopsis sp. NPDC005232]|uniref:glycosyltransferase n=1 Tax=Amycolatopsis sp. NPDC005232 TaxID=3157027 RepID=UPI0033B0BDA8